MNATGQARVIIDHLPEAVADATAFGLVVSKLIANAVKFAGPGRPRVIGIGGEIASLLACFRAANDSRGIPPFALPAQCLARAVDEPG